jgi:acetate kinase
VLVNETVLDVMREFASLSPLHNPHNIAGILACQKMMPATPMTVMFDTGFHSTMPEEAYLCAIPYEWYEKYGVRKYGFHGTSHKYISERIAKLLNRHDLKVISCHLGNGGSITAIENGKCIDTTMGLTPMAGIPMGTRCGDIDPSIIEYIMKQTGKSIDEITVDLNKNSGFIGVSGVSSDSRDIEEGIQNGDQRCRLARDIFVRKVVGFIANYNNLLNGADVIVFTAGIGENSPETRKAIIDRLKSLDILLDEEKNNCKGKETIITSEKSKIMGYVVPTNEELMIANEAYILSH